MEAAFKVRSEGVGVHSVAQAGVGEVEVEEAAEAEAKVAIAGRPRCIGFEFCEQRLGVRLEQPGLYGIGIAHWHGTLARHIGTASMACLKLEKAQGRETERRDAGCVQVGKRKGSKAELKHNSLCVGPPDLTYQHSK
jgi:hypothetical protein